jgi:hypothetical protein
MSLESELESELESRLDEEPESGPEAEPPAWLCAKAEFWGTGGRRSGDEDCPNAIAAPARSKQGTHLKPRFTDKINPQ